MTKGVIEMRTNSPLLDRVEKLARKVAHGGDEKLVFVDAQGGFDCCPVSGARASALTKFPPPRYVVIGAFPASVSVAELAKALRGRSC